MPDVRPWTADLHIHSKYSRACSRDLELENLAWWAQRCREWDAQGRDVFVYFNNDGEGHAVRNAWTLKSLLGR